MNWSNLLMPWSKRAFRWFLATYLRRLLKLRCFWLESISFLHRFEGPVAVQVFNRKWVPDLWNLFLLWSIGVASGSVVGGLAGFRSASRPATHRTALSSRGFSRKSGFVPSNHRFCVHLRDTFGPKEVEKFSHVFSSHVTEFFCPRGITSKG